MFVKGDDKIDFRYVAEVIDIGRSANVDHIGLMTPKILGGPVAGSSGAASLKGRQQAIASASGLAGWR